MYERYEETAQRPLIRMRPARMALDKAFRAMVDRVEALVEVNGAADYETFIRELNAILERHKNLLAQQQGRNKKTQLTKNN
jgi:hypothetical protein